MIYTVPDYYNEFKCIAGECEDTCCSGWQIVIDDRKLMEYMSSGKYPTIDMKEYVDFEEGVFKQQKDRRCKFLRDDNLCKLCFEYGEDALCKTCHLYPRHIEEFENVRETTLSLSCPEVARILLNKRERVELITTEDDKEETYEDFDFMLYSMLLDARDVMLEILQNRSIDIDVRAGMVLGLANDIDIRLSDGRLFTVQELLTYVASQEALSKSEKKIKDFTCNKSRVYRYMKKKFETLFKLEPIGYDWINLYTESKRNLFGRGEEHYTKWSERFDEYMSQKELTFDIQMEQILVYFVITYFCGAVYDGEIYGKGKLCIYSAYYIKELLKAAFIRNGGQLSQEEIEDITLRYSRELEHSDANLNRIEKF